MAAGDQVPVNRVAPPWGKTATGQGEPLPYALIHAQVQHPNFAHAERDQTSPFAQGLGFANHLRGQPRFHPPHSPPGGLHIGVRK